MLAQPLFDYIQQVRGNVDPIEQVSGLSVPSKGLSKPQKLGYIDEDR